ncbi:MAG TPA: hypothetical protein VFB46_17495 [Gemmatimonadaceae bacterium]|nr:hypothetical protein [Gemmatimonadaceae bacterium]
MPFYHADMVRIVRLVAPERDVDGAGDPPPQPRVGDVCVIVEAVDEDIYLVERCTDDGRTLWIAEFMASELELVQR